LKETNSNDSANMLISVTRNGMGSGDGTLPHKLMQTFLRLVEDNDKLPGAICFYTEGVRLVTDASPVLDELIRLEEKGVHLIICQTCLQHYDIEDRVRVGVVGGMGDIIAAMWTADKVVSL